MNAFDLKGAVVKVVRGRNVPKGTVGQVFWVGRDKYSARYGQVKYRIGLKDAIGAVHWTAATNVERVGHIEYLMERNAAEAAREEQSYRLACEDAERIAAESEAPESNDDAAFVNYDDPCPESARDEIEAQFEGESESKKRSEGYYDW